MKLIDYLEVNLNSNPASICENNTSDVEIHEVEKVVNNLLNKIYNDLLNGRPKSKEYDGTYSISGFVTIDNILNIFLSNGMTKNESNQS